MDRMVVLVMDSTAKSTDVMDAWQEAGVSGVTVWESRGIGRMHDDFYLRDDVPIMPSLATLLQSREEDHRTIFTLVDGDEMVDKLIAVTEAITGGLDGPNRGILFVLPVLRAVGVLNSTT